MSATRELIIALGVQPDDQSGFSDRVAAWLCTTGWAVPDPDVEDLEYPDHEPDLLGPAGGVTGDSTISCGVGNGYMANMWLALDGTGPAKCPECGTLAAEESFTEALQDWPTGGREPVIECSGCGTIALMGDMDVTASVVVGNPAIIIVFDNRAYPPNVNAIAERLRDQLREAFGSRWAYVSEME